MPKARLIGLYSSAPGSGKTTVASYLSGHGFRIIPFAESLKRMAHVFLSELGLTDKEIEFHLYRSKEAPLPFPDLKLDTRHICQTLGTEWGRTCIHPDVWLHCWQRKVEQNMKRGIDVVVDDVRFPNEAQLIHNLGGELWRVERPAVVRTTSHASEGSLDDWTFHRRIVNAGTLLELYALTKARVDALNENATSACGTTAPTTASKSFVRTSEAVLKLGISRETLLKRRKEGFFVAGEHWTPTGTHSTASILWDVEACRNRLASCVPVKEVWR